jgi:hypothetical protein
MITSVQQHADILILKNAFDNYRKVIHEDENCRVANWMKYLCKKRNPFEINLIKKRVDRQYNFFCGYSSILIVQSKTNTTIRYSAKKKSK